jgi:glycosyltransferase involved in cell wall biosynthesis
MIDLHKDAQILYVSSVDVSIGNGPGVNEREFILALNRAIGERAHFLIPQPAEAVPDLPVRACTFSRPHRGHSLKYFPGHVLSTMRLADQVLANRHFDLLLFRLDLLPFAPLYITKRHRIPFALKTLGQGLINIFSEKIGWPLGPFLAQVNELLVKQLVKNAIVADTVSKLQKQYLAETLTVDLDEIICIDNAVNTDRFFPARAAEARKELDLAKFGPIVGYVGTRPWERGGMPLIETAPQLLLKYPNLGLVILGDGAGLNDLKKRAHELQVQDHCVFTGYVPFHKVPLYVNSLDVGVSISLRSDRQAASELKVRQYLACGKPVVASPGSNDFLTDSGLGSIVQPDDLADITAELDHWLGLSPDERGAFACRAKKYVQDNLSIEAAVAKRFELWTERLRSRQLLAL